MEAAILRLIGGFSISREQRALLAVCSVSLFGFLVGFQFDSLNFKAVALFLLAVMGIGVLALPYAWAIAIFFFYLGIEGGLKLLTNYNPVVHVGADLLIVALCAKWFLSFLLQRTRVSRDLPPFIPLFVAHLAWFFIEFANPYGLGLVPSLAAAKIYVTMFTLYFFGYYLAAERKNHALFIWPWVLVLALQIVTGLYQSSIGAASVMALGPSWGAALARLQGYAFRPFGTTSQPGGASIFVFITIPLVAYLIVRARSHLVRLVMLAILPLATMLLAFSQVRSALLKSIIGASIFLVLGIEQASRETRRRLLIALPVAAAVMILSLPALTSRWIEGNPGNQAAIDRTLSVFDYETASRARVGTLDRIMLFAETIPLGAGHSRTGPAAGKFWYEMQSQPFFKTGFFTDNFWATTIAEIGIPGSLILTLLLGSVLWRGFRGARRMRDPSLAPLQAALLGGTFSIVAGLWAAEGVLYNPEAAYFWFFAGVMMRLPKMEPVDRLSPAELNHPML